VLGVVLAVGGAWLVREAVESHRRLHDQVDWLHARLAYKRTQLARQREAMARMVEAVEHVSRTAGDLRTRALEARRLAHMEETPAPTPGIVPVAFRPGDLLVPEVADAALAIEELDRLGDWTVDATESFAVLSALLRDRAERSRHDAPSRWPVRGLVTSAFGMRRSPYGGRREMHGGVDIRARHGTPVTSGGSGEVIYAGRDPGYGNLVIVSHGPDIDTFYGHLSAIYVREGQRVERGQALGAVGASGRATGTHLHYEVRVRNKPVDPHAFLVN
jgi:murein DD-endopeptidase MepM/ murein hydrolase activator NlpD